MAAIRDPEKGLAQLTEQLGSPIDDRRVIGVPLDLTNPTSIEAAAVTIEEAGGVDGLVHNAGLAGAGAVEEMPPEVVEDIFRTNSSGRSASPAISSRGCNAWTWTDCCRVQRGSPSGGSADQRLLGEQSGLGTLG